MCFISWLTQREWWKNKASNDGWMILCVRQSNSSSRLRFCEHTDTHQCLQGPVTVTVAAGEESCLGSRVFGTSKAASHQKFFFLLNIGLCVCGCVLWCFCGSGRVSKRSFSADLLSVFLFSYVCVFPFISSQAHVAKLAVKSLYCGPSPNFRSVNVWSR